MPLTIPMLDAWLEPGRHDGEADRESLRTSSLGCHASWYRDTLSQCSEAMLHYEWEIGRAHV